jgi:Ca2+-binding RTX toxin-like protein
MSFFSVRYLGSVPGEALPALTPGANGMITKTLDWNGDGFLDLFIFNGTFPPVAETPQPAWVLLSDGAGGFLTAPQVFPGPVTGSVHPRQAEFADFNGDGRIDLFIADHGYDTDPFPGFLNSLFLQNTQGELIEANDRLPGFTDFSHALTSGDIDGDQDIDILVMNLSSQDGPFVYFLINDGHANFTVKTDGLPDRYTTDDLDSLKKSLFVDLVDFNGDGYLDLFIGAEQAFFEQSEIILNDANGNFPDENTFLLPLRTDRTQYDNPHGLQAMEILDLNNDGSMDLFLTFGFGAGTGGSVQVLISNGDGTYRDETQDRLRDGFVFEGEPSFFTSQADVNGDGYVDIVNHNFGAGAPIAWINDGEGFFTTVLAPSDINHGGVWVGALPGTEGVLNYLEVFEWQGEPGHNLIVQDVAISTGPDFSDPAASGVPGFNEAFYLRENAAAAEAVSSGLFSNGLAHFIAEGRTLDLRIAANIGNSGADTLYAGQFGSEVSGLGGNDILYGNLGDDTLSGGDGSDFLDGGDGGDTLDGGTGDDTLVGRSGLDTLVGGDGNDVLYGGDDGDTLSGDAGIDFVDGGSGADTLYGGLDADTVVGRFGDDVLSGGGGDDTLYGSPGFDTLYGDAGNDLLDGGDQGDTLDGGEGDDTLYGRFGNDTLVGGAGADLLNGNPGFDTISGGDGNDTLYGGDQGDTLDGDGGADLLYGETGNDTLRGGLGNDTLDGGVGSDFLDGGEGDDTLSGGTQIDTLVGRAGADTLSGGDGNDSLYGGDDNDTLNGDAGLDFLDGGTGNDLLYGGLGADTLVGRFGNDELHGGDGNDVLYGSPGLDTLYGDAGNDTLDGGDDADALYGGDGDDVLYGRFGDDILDGGAGSDTLYGGPGSDVFRISPSTGSDADTIADFDPGSDTLDLVDSGFADFAAVQAALVRSGSSAILTLPTGDTVTFLNTDTTDFTSGNVSLVSTPASADIGQLEKVVVAEPSFSLADGVSGMASGSALFSLAGGAVDLTPSQLDVPVVTGSPAHELVPQPAGVIELYEPAAMLEADLPALDSLADHHALLWELHIHDITWVDGVATISAES